MRLLLAAVLLLASALCSACLWDSDTIRIEAGGKLDIVHAIVGRFERNPPLYYKMRLERVSREILTTPNKLELYDDAAVAADRLKNHDLAIEWAQKKHKVLMRLDPKREKQKDHWCRYFANLGTFKAHKWFREGMRNERIAQVKSARADIGRALEINPDAHFGREEFQAHVLDYVLYLQTKPEYARSLDEHIGKTDASREEAVRGLAGLVVLGDAWNSVDIFRAIDSLLFMSRQRALAYLATLRVQELLKSGMKPQLSESEAGSEAELVHGHGPLESERINEHHRAEFKKLRENAEAYHAKREQFMMAKLERGEHPDTHPNFWQGYVEVPPVELTDPPGYYFLRNQTNIAIWSMFALVLSLSLIGILLIRKGFRYLRARRAGLKPR